MKLLLVRHGETDWNRLGLVQGSRTNKPLNDTGKQQANETAMQLTDKDIAIIYTSPLKRTHQTAEIINQHINVNLETHDGLTEKDFGTLSGKAWEDMVNITGDSNIRDKDRNAEYDYRPWQGESVTNVRERFYTFLEHIKNNHDQTDEVLGVTSSGIVRLAHKVFSNQRLDHVPNASLHEFNI